MKNLLVIHLESISRQRLAAFAPAFPNLLRLLAEGRVYDRFHASATSTMMVMGYLFHGNDFEYDSETEFDGMRPARNNPHLFSLLQERGYRCELLCLNGFHGVRPIRLAAWGDDLPALWETNDFPTLHARFEQASASRPFAVYLWNLISHVEHSLALAPHARGLTDQILRACALADETIGALRATLERRGILDQTTIVLFGDHGDDYWTHGFRGGMIHGTEPTTDIVWTPLAIRDASLGAGVDGRLARTIDLAPTCLQLLGVDAALAFEHSGVDLLATAPPWAFSQNFTANQPDDAARGVRQAFSVTDGTHMLVASRRGLELYAAKLDPGNHCNLLHFFEQDDAGRLRLQARPGAFGHYRAALQENPRAAAALAEDFAQLREALAARVAAKRAWIVSRGAQPVHALDPACLRTLNRDGRDAFIAPAPGTPRGFQPFEFSFRLR